MGGPKKKHELTDFSNIPSLSWRKGMTIQSLIAARQSYKEATLATLTELKGWVLSA